MNEPAHCSDSGLTKTRAAPLYRYFDLDIPRAETPHMRAYYDRLAARPAYAEHVMISYDSLRAK